MTRGASPDIAKTAANFEVYIRVQPQHARVFLLQYMAPAQGTSREVLHTHTPRVSLYFPRCTFEFLYFEDI